VDDEVVDPLFRVRFLGNGGYDDWLFWFDWHDEN
jgi:hypothetical protein